MTSPVLYYPLNTNGSNSLLSENTGNAGDITNIGTVTTVTDSEFGDVADFNGSNYLQVDFADTPSELYSPSSTYSTSMWVKSSNTGNNMAIHSIGVNSNKQRTTLLMTTYMWLGFSGFNTVGDQIITGLLSDTWYHVALIRDVDNFKIYVDGVIAMDNTTLGVNPADNSFTIGGTMSGGSWDGQLTEFKIYDYSLDETEITMLAASRPEPFSVTIISNTPYSISTSWVDASSTSYRIHANSTGNEEIIRYTSESEYTIIDLVPEETYMIDVYGTTDEISYGLLGSGTIVTSVDISGNYDISTLLDGDGVYDLSIYSDTNQDEIVDKITSLLTHSDRILMDINGIPTYCTFCEESNSLQMDNGVVLLPFETGMVSSGCTVISGEETTAIGYSELDNNIIIDGNPYAIGDVIMMNGRKVTIRNV